MRDLAMWIYLSIAIFGCSSAKNISVLSDKPNDCDALARISTWQCSSGSAGSNKTMSTSLETLKKEAVKLGGNTLSCCEIAEEELAIYGVNPKSGKITCSGLKEHTAEIYYCKK